VIGKHCRVERLYHFRHDPKNNRQKKPNICT
jgi:hypothetical protein